MAGTGLIAIKRRIKSITNTKKITKAMGLVATSKLRKTREQLEINNKYYSEFHDVIQGMLWNFEGESIYITGNNSKRKVYIVLTSDTGLCGGYNWAVVNKTIEELKNNEQDTALITVGQKGRGIFNRMNMETLAEYIDIPNIPAVKDANIIIKKVMNMYEKSEIGEINLVYTKFISQVHKEVRVEKLLPLTIKDDNKKPSYVEFESNEQQLLDDVMESYLSSELLNAMIHSKASEQSSRMEAMDGATRNANDLLEKLQLKYNRIRQSAITQEISEIVGGAESQR